MRVSPPPSLPGTCQKCKKALARPEPGNRDTENGIRKACACSPRVPFAPASLLPCSPCARVGLLLVCADSGRKHARMWTSTRRHVRACELPASACCSLARALLMVGAHNSADGWTPVFF